MERQRKEAEREREKQDAYIRNEFIRAKSELEEAWRETDTGSYGLVPTITKNRVKSNINTSAVSAIIRKRQPRGLVEGYDSS